VIVMSLRRSSSLPLWNTSPAWTRRLGAGVDGPPACV
jgi:hypothetical protein